MVPPSIPIPDTLKGVDDLIHAGFEAYRSLCFKWLLAATGLVVVGLVLEGPELWHEITSILRNWRFSRRFHFSLPENHVPNWAKLAAFVGWFFIVGGVVGEYMADSFVSKADGYVQTFDEILLTEAHEESAHAEATAKGFDAQIADSNAKAKSAEATAKGFEAQIADANRRASEAAKTAEDEHLARVRIEEKLAGWKLDAGAQARIIAKMKQYKKTPFDLGTNPGEVLFMEVIDGILGSAEWIRQPPKDSIILINNKARINYVSGIYVEIASSRFGDLGPAAQALAEALRAEGIPVQAQMSPNEPDSTAIHVVIGSK